MKLKVNSKKDPVPTELNIAEQGPFNEGDCQSILTVGERLYYEISQPLQIASGFSELLLIKTSENDPIHQTIWKIKAQVDRIVEVSREFSTMNLVDIKNTE